MVKTNRIAFFDASALIRAASNSLALFGRNQVGRSVIDLPTQPEVRTLSFGTSCVGYN